MKKLVCFTLAMVLALAGAAIAGADEVNGNLSGNIVPVAAGDNSVAVSANNNKLLSPDVEVKDNSLRYQSANIETDDVLSNNKVAVATDQAQLGVQNAKDHGKVAGRDINPDNRSNYDNCYVVDNAILANVNVAADKKGHRPPQQVEPAFGRFPNGGHDDNNKDECCPSVSQTNTFNKTQCGEIGGSFGGATGVSNANAAGGNMNKQTAYTTIGVAFVK